MSGSSTGSTAGNGIGRLSGRTMKIDVGIYNGSVDIGDFLRAIDFTVATEGKGYTEEEAAQAHRVLLTTRVSTEVHEYINSLPFDIQDDYDALKKALKEQYTNQDDNLDALGMEISCLCQRPEESLRDYINRTASMVSKCRGREELYRSLARAFHKGLLNNLDRGPLGTAEWVWKLKGRELLLRCLDFMRKWDSSTTDFASARAGEEERIKRGIEEGRRKDKEMAELWEKVRREVEMELRGSRDPVDLGYPYRSQPLQVSAVFQDQYPKYPDYRPPGDRQQFRPANRPNYRQDYPPPVNRNPCYNCARVGHRMAECPEPESSMEFQQSVYDQVHGPGRGHPPRARNQRMPQGGSAYPTYDHPAPHQGRPAYDHPAPHQGRPAYDNPAPYQGRPAYDNPVPHQE